MKSFKTKFLSLAGAGALVAAGLLGAGAPSAQADVWDRVAECESGGRWNISTGNGYHGGLQFSQSSWNAAGGKGSPSSASKAEQKRVAKNLLKMQGPGAWPVCSKKAGLTRGNGGAASTGDVQSSRSTKSSQVSQAAPNRTQNKRAGTNGATGTASRTVNVSVTQLQRAVGATPDGVVGQETRAKARAFLNENRGSYNGKTTQLQGAVGVAQDGIVGPVTTAATLSVVG